MNSEKSETSKLETHIITSLDNLDKMFSSEIPPQAISQVKNSVIKMVPYARGENKEKLNRVVEYLNGVEKKPEEFFYDINNIIALMQTMVQLNVIGAEMEPNNFNINYPLAYHYINTASFIESVGQSEDHKPLIDEYKQKGLQSAKDLVKKFPDKAKAYHERAFFAIVMESDKEKALKLYEHCLSLDPKFELCKTNYEDLREKLNRVNP